MLFDCIVLLVFLISLPIMWIIQNISLMPVNELGLYEVDEALYQNSLITSHLIFQFLLAEFTQWLLWTLPDLLLFTSQSQSKCVMDVIARVAVFQQPRMWSGQETHFSSWHSTNQCSLIAWCSVEKKLDLPNFLKSLLQVVPNIPYFLHLDISYLQWWR